MLFVNVPIGAALIAAAVVSLTESRAVQRPSLDLAGAVTVTGGLALLVYGIVSTDTRSWVPRQPWARCWAGPRCSPCSW